MASISFDIRQSQEYRFRTMAGTAPEVRLTFPGPSLSLKMSGVGPAGNSGRRKLSYINPESVCAHCGIVSELSVIERHLSEVALE